MKINETSWVILDRAEKLLFTDYEKQWNDAENIDGYIDEEEVLQMIDDLCSKVDRLQEQLEDKEEQHQEQLREFYRPKSSYAIYGVREQDFH